MCLIPARSRIEYFAFRVSKWMRLFGYCLHMALSLPGSCDLLHCKYIKSVPPRRPERSNLSNWTKRTAHVNPPSIPLAYTCQKNRLFLTSPLLVLFSPWLKFVLSFNRQNSQDYRLLPGIEPSLNIACICR